MFTGMDHPLTFEDLLPLVEKIFFVVYCVFIHDLGMKTLQDNGANILMASRFLLAAISYDCLILSFQWFISAG